MNLQTIYNGDIIIATYMGGVLRADHYFDASIDSCEISHLINNTMVGRLRFKTDWNWLIPVLKKISKKDDINKAIIATIMSKCDYEIDEVWKIVVNHLELTSFV